MKTYINQFKDGGFEVVCPEHEKNGFTNHRLAIRRGENYGRIGWHRAAYIAFQPDIFLSDIHALTADLMIISASANPFIAECAREALRIVSSK